jgi:hypothetical protein
MWSERIEKITDMIRQNYDHSTDCGGGDGRKNNWNEQRKTTTLYNARYVFFPFSNVVVPKWYSCVINEITLLLFMSPRLVQKAF